MVTTKRRHQSPYLACYDASRGGDYWLCRTCGEPFTFLPGIPHCEPEPEVASGAVVIAISVGVFSLMVFAAWAFACLMGWC